MGCVMRWRSAHHDDEPSPSQNQEQKPLDLPMKPTWRMTGEYPLIAGVWSVVENKGTLVTIVQHGGEFVATASYKSGEETVSWRAEGRISRSGHITMSLVHTQPHPPDKWLPQTRTAVLGLHGKSLEGYAAFEGGGHKFTWKLRGAAGGGREGVAEMSRQHPCFCSKKRSRNSPRCCQQEAQSPFPEKGKTVAHLLLSERYGHSMAICWRRSRLALRPVVQVTNFP